ncbi:MAG: pseudouridine synthase [Candidatus Pacebacteria bacterium]|nr:pseudouridine synthase [Candidatus Paceibacterota bacterium]
MEKPLYPMRINKYLALKNYATRRGADELIEKNRVLINGRFAVLGDKVNENDNVEVRQGKKPEAYAYYAYNKPVDVITHSPQRDEIDIAQSLNSDTGFTSGPLAGLFPIGRLDKNSHGLIILTNDGRVTDRLLNPKHNHDKEYLVKTVNKLPNNFKEKMEAGVDIGEEEPTKPCKIKVIDDYTFSITLT